MNGKTTGHIYIFSTLCHTHAMNLWTLFYFISRVYIEVCQRLVKDFVFSGDNNHATLQKGPVVLTFGSTESE